ncbi:site-specific DNA-methyltransferase [Candidatus Woesearchaeota archaeon]|nr:site-specific DNA-methyltransferase [Candidatus Woesearchaeota archaeon]
MKTTHKIICGDCVNELRKFKEGSVDLIVTDPPFNIGKDYGGYKDRKKKGEYLDWCKKWLGECIRVLKDGGALYLFNYPENNAYLVPFLDENLNFKRWMTWHYPVNTGMSPTNFTRSQHSILFYVKGKKPRIFNKKEIAEPYRNPTDKRILERIKNGSNGKTPYDVFHFNIVKNVNKNKTPHPCQLPDQLVEIFVKASSREGDLILDPFGGSFTVSATSKRLGRNSISIEINPEFCRIGKERLNKIANLKEFIM